MPQIRIWVYDGILASGVAGSIDVFTAANAVLVVSMRGRPRRHCFREGTAASIMLPG